MIKMITRILIVFSIVGLTIWDVIAYLKGGGGATISEQIWDLSKDFPIIPFSFGILMGHFFTIPPRKNIF